MPIHPHRFWIHLRAVFIPMSYIYAKRWKVSRDPLIMALREVWTRWAALRRGREYVQNSDLLSVPQQELYVQDYRTIDWPAQRNNVHQVDIYSPHSAVMNALYVVLSQWERSPIKSLRNIALDRTYRQIVLEDENTSYQCLGPVNKMVNQIARYIVDGRDSVSYRQHKIKRQDFMWLGNEGMMMCGTNGSQLWDLGFTTQALVESGLAEEEENRPAMLKALSWLEKTQIRDNPRHFESNYRHQSKGAWPFSTKEQSYTVSDCTAEGLKAALYIQDDLRYVSYMV